MSNEIKDAIQDAQKAWDEYKKANNERLDKLEKSQGVGELEVKLEKINEDLKGFSELKKSVEDTQKAVNRLANSHDPEVKAESKEVLNSALKKWMLKGMSSDIKSIGLDEKEYKALQSNIDPQGGYTVTPFMGGVEKRLFDTSPVRALARSVTIGTNEYVGYFDDNEFGAGWVGEIATRSDTATADLGEKRIPVREMYARFTISERLLEDSIWNIEQWAEDHVADKFSRLEATGFVSGAGALQPEGLVTATAKTTNGDVYTRGQIGAKLAASTTAITTDELIDTRGLLKSGYRDGAYWAFNRDTEAYIRKLVDGQGNYIWQPNFTLGEADTLLGSPVAIFEDMADRGASAVSVIFGDIRQTYLIVDRVGMSILRDPYTSASSGKVYLHMRKRVSGGIVNYDSMKYLKQAAS